MSSNWSLSAVVTTAIRLRNSARGVSSVAGQIMAYNCMVSISVPYGKWTIRRRVKSITLEQIDTQFVKIELC